MARDRAPHWLSRLRNPAYPAFGAAPAEIDAAATYKAAHAALVQLTGVGPKVADCVCLMGLGWGGAVPVDTHVWQIALRDYNYGGGGGAGGKRKTATLTKAMYDGVGDFFRGLWGEHAGWAHSVLFTADLNRFGGREDVRDLKRKGMSAQTAPEPHAEGGEDKEKGVYLYHTSISETVSKRRRTRD